jgi:4'-phosphopantetheinyl transferase
MPTITSPAQWQTPPDRLELPAREVHVWRVNLDDLRISPHDAARVLNDQERQRAGRYRFTQDRDRFILRRCLLRQLLGRYLASEPASLPIAGDERGKPYLVGRMGVEPLSFNLSHSRGMAVYAITRGLAVGIDVEYCRGDLDFLRIAERCFSPAEAAWLRSIPGPSRREVFFLLWTCKEACVKATGEGLAFPLGQVEVTIMPEQGAAVARMRQDGGDDIVWRIRLLVPQDGFIAAVTTGSGDRELRCWEGAPAASNRG